MDRYEEIEKAVCKDDADRTIYGPLIKKCVLLERKLEELEALPHIIVNPKNKAMQKTTPAHKQYKELLQQYANIIRVLSRANGNDAQDEVSPLRKWAKERAERNAD